jgi:hypothetical protein
MTSEFLSLSSSGRVLSFCLYAKRKLILREYLSLSSNMASLSVSKLVFSFRYYNKGHTDKKSYKRLKFIPETPICGYE